MARLSQVFQVLLIRHCQDEVMTAESDRQICKRFEHWHDPSFRAVDDPFEGRRDPCLTEKGILAASYGIEDMLRCSMNQNDGYGGVRGGLRQIVKEFDAEVTFHFRISLNTFEWCRFGFESLVSCVDRGLTVVCPWFDRSMCECAAGGVVTAVAGHPNLDRRV